MAGRGDAHARGGDARGGTAVTGGGGGVVRGGGAVAGLRPGCPELMAVVGEGGECLGWVVGSLPWSSERQRFL